MSNGKFDTSHVKNVCERKLSIQFRKGKECNGWVTFNGIRISRITVPKGRKYIPPKTYKNMANQLSLTTSEFDKLLECPLTTDLYIKLLRNKGFIS